MTTETQIEIKTETDENECRILDDVELDGVSGGFCKTDKDKIEPYL